MAKFFTKFNPPAKVVSPHGGVSLTDQSAKKDTDINVILKRHNIGDHSAIKSLGIYADVSEMQDFAANVDFVRRAKEDFGKLPSDIRDRFGNDPVALVNFLADSANNKEAVKLGLKFEKAVEKPLAEQIGEAVAKSMSGANPGTPAE